MRCSLPPSDSSQAGSLASMIDIIFLLLVFFVVTASMDREQLDLSVAPPKIMAGIETKSLPPDRLTVNVQADGTVKIGYRTIPSDRVNVELGASLRALKTTGNTVLIVNGAEKCRHKHIARVLETAANAGFGRARINAEIAAPEAVPEVQP